MKTHLRKPLFAVAMACLCVGTALSQPITNNDANDVKFVAAGHDMIQQSTNAATVSPSGLESIPGLNALPESWRGPVIALFALLGIIGPIIGRAIHAYQSGGSVLSAIYKGTNQPRAPEAEQPTAGGRIGMFFLIASLAIAPVAFTGCGVFGIGGKNITKEARVYYSFRDTWTVTHNAYAGWCERVVQGKVSKSDEQTVDKAWNDFRAAFKISFEGASKDWTKATPEDLTVYSQKVLNVIRQLTH